MVSTRFQGSRSLAAPDYFVQHRLSLGNDTNLEIAGQPTLPQICIPNCHTERLAWLLSVYLTVCSSFSDTTHSNSASNPAVDQEHSQHAVAQVCSDAQSNCSTRPEALKHANIWHAGPRPLAGKLLYFNYGIIINLFIMPSLYVSPNRLPTICSLKCN